MSNILCVADFAADGSLKKVSKELVAAAKGLGGGQVYALLFGNEGAASELAAVGAETIFVSDVSEYSPEGWATVAAELAKEKDCKVVLAAHSYAGKDFAPRVAAKLGASIVSDVVELKDDGGKVVTRKPVYSGKAYAEIKINTDFAVATVRPNSQDIKEEAGAGNVEKISISPGDIQTKFQSTEQTGGNKIQLTDASIIVSGGRGVKGPENFPMLQELCDTIGAALGASRAAVDSGWISHDHQVGQTGKTVSPNCYIACGISGAIQHLAGMGSSKNIVAINKDPDAPIFKVATYGVVHDLFEVVPALTAEFKKVLS